MSRRNGCRVRLLEVARPLPRGTKEPRARRLMLIFLVPLKNRACSNDWDTVSRFCRSAIASMLANSQSHVVLICRDEPDGIEKSNNLAIHAIDAPTPTTPQEMMVDKYRKLAAGLELARSYAPCWLMRADADDLISNRIHPYIEGKPGAARLVCGDGLDSPIWPLAGEAPQLP